MKKILYVRSNSNCNSRCFMCDYWKCDKREISVFDFEKILNENEDVNMIRFTGGEPLLCSCLPSLINMCSKQNIKSSIITNGLLLNEKIKELVDMGLSQVVISLDGSNDALHDELRGVSGCFKNIVMALERVNIEFPGLRIRVNTVVSHKNVHDLVNILNILEKYNVEQWSIIPIKMEGYKWCDYISLEELKRVYRDFQLSVKNTKVKLMGYSSDWARNIEGFWNGGYNIRPNGVCNLTQFVLYYNPFEHRYYPCNCVPHRLKKFSTYDEEKNWYYQHGSINCVGCEPLNAFCSDFPNVLEYDIFEF